MDNYFYMKIKNVLVILLGVLLLCPGFSYDQSKIPNVLQTWVPWVLKDQSKWTCPFVFNNFEDRQCAWPGVLKIDLTSKGATITQSWQVYEKAEVPLLGNSKYWPQNLSVDGINSIVLDRSNIARVTLKPGKHNLRWNLNWKQTPKYLQLPSIVGLVALSKNGKSIDSFRLNEQNQLWLEQNKSGVIEDKKVNKEFLSIKVFRNYTDSIPAQLITYYDLEVGGKSREVKLNVGLSAELLHLSVNSGLPVKIDKDGRLAVQLRQGRWNVQLQSRFLEKQSEISLGDTLSTEYEIWVLNRDNENRVISIGGLTPVDAKQFNVPTHWLNMSAYRFSPEDKLMLTEQKRGAEPAPDNEISLYRQIWMDFDGGGYSVADTISGEMNKDWRMDLAQPFELGRVVADNQSILITKQNESAKSGFEIRKGNLNVKAESRLNSSTRSFASGWSQSLKAMNVSLVIPPGWKLFAVSGPDSASGTWVSHWSLLLIFFVFIVSLAFFKLKSPTWAGIAFFATILTAADADAPRWLWINIMFTIGLLSVLPDGRLKKLVNIVKWIFTICLLVFVFNYSYYEIKSVIYPTLQKSRWSLMSKFNTSSRSERSKMAHAPQEVAFGSMADKVDNKAYQLEEAELDSRAVGGSSSSGGGGSESISKLSSNLIKSNMKKGSSANYRNRQSYILDDFDPNAVVQTGPGMPDWSWNQAYFSWTGPILAEQKIRLFYLSPFFVKLISILKVFLLCLLTLSIFDRKRLDPVVDKYAPYLKKSKLFLLGLVLLSASSWGQNTIPSKKILTELKTFVTAKPECLPQCASINRVNVDVRKSMLSLRFDVSLSENVFFPVPFTRNVWQATSIIHDTIKDLKLVQKNTNQYLYLPKGNHRFVLRGTIRASQQWQLAFSLSPKNVYIGSQNYWDVQGINEDGNIQGSIEFIPQVLSGQSSSSAKIEESSKVNSENLTPFLFLTRRLKLGINWSIDNTIRSYNTLTEPLTIKIPLLEGEVVLDKNVTVKKGFAYVRISPHRSQISWNSSLKIADNIKIKASEDIRFFEHWMVNVGTKWHIQSEGAPVVAHKNSQNYWQPLWKPWPGENLLIIVTKPMASEGESLTVKKSSMEYKVGKKVTDATLSLTLLTSQGSQHDISLPEGAKLQKVEVNNQNLPLEINAGKLTLPLGVGQQNIKVSWEELGGLAMRYKTAPVSIGASSVNQTTTIQYPGDRWIVWLSGQGFRPYVLFWAKLVFLLMVSYLLAKFKLAPIRTYEWLLLTLGLSQISAPLFFWIIAFFIVMALKRDVLRIASRVQYNVVQVLLAFMAIVSAEGIYAALKKGLLGQPLMIVTGNGSYSTKFNFYLDRVDELLPQPMVYSFPIFVYRLVMLLWALWLAMALLKWSKWLWQGYISEGLWKKKVITDKLDSET